MVRGLVVEFFDTLMDAVLNRISSLFDEIANLRCWVIDVEHTIVDGNGDRDGEQDTAAMQLELIKVRKCGALGTSSLLEIILVLRVPDTCSKFWVGKLRASLQNQYKCWEVYNYQTMMVPQLHILEATDFTH